MNKTMRLLLIVVVLTGILLAAGSKAAWAIPAAQLPHAAAASVNNGSAAVVEPAGSVRALNCDAQVEVKGGKSVCGFVQITSIAPGTDVFASHIAPDGFQSDAITLFFKSGSAELCFAAPVGGSIMFMPSGSVDWVAVPTNLNTGFACATVSENGDYALGAAPAP